MSLIRKVFSDSAFTAIRSLVTIARGIVVIPLITNFLGAGGYGVWVTVLSIIGLLSSTGGMHLHGSLIRYGSQESLENQTYSDVLLFAFIIGSCLAIFTIMISIFVDLSILFEDQVADPFTLVLVSGFLLLSSIVFKININFPRAKGRVKIYDLAKITKELIEIILLFIVFSSGSGLIVGLIVLGILSALMNVIILLLIIVKFHLPLPNPSNFKRYVHYGLPMMPKELSTSLLTNGDKYLLLYFLGPAAVGIYSVAETICKPLINLTGIFNPTLYPTISQAWDDSNFSEITDVYKSIFRYYSIIGIPAMFGVVVLSKPLLLIISTPTIAEEGFYLVPIFIFGYFLKGYDNPIRYILTSAERTEIIGGSVVIVVLMNIALNIFLIPKLGMIGAAGATFVSQSVLFGLILYYSFSELPITIPWLTIGRSLFAAIIMSLVLVLLDLGLGTYTMLFIYPVLGVILYFSVLLIIGEFSSDELSRIRKTIIDNV